MLGLLDPPYMVPYPKIKDTLEPGNSERHHAVSLEMALESVVLLKNADNFLPLNKQSLKSNEVIGPLADKVRWDWYGGAPPHATTPLEGIEKAAGPNIT